MFAIERLHFLKSDRKRRRLAAVYAWLRAATRRHSMLRNIAATHSLQLFNAKGGMSWKRRPRRAIFIDMTDCQSYRAERVDEAQGDGYE
jgi:hypothetical protein